MKSDMQARGRRPLASCCENAVPGTPTVPGWRLRARMADGAMAGTDLERRPLGSLPVGPGTAARRAAGGSLPSALTGRRHGTRSAAGGVCHSNVTHHAERWDSR